MQFHALDRANLEQAVEAAADRLPSMNVGMFLVIIGPCHWQTLPIIQGVRSNFDPCPCLCLWFGKSRLPNLQDSGITPNACGLQCLTNGKIGSCIPLDN